MDKRAKITVTGRVQKAGYRRKVDRVAFGLGLKGTVRNLADGSVEIVCEGPPEAIRRFARGIDIRKYPVRVDQVGIAWSRATGEFAEFDVLWDERLDRDPAWKLELGIDHLEEISEKQDLTLDAIRAMDSDIKAVDSNTGRRFDRLDRTYGSFGRTLKTVSKDMKGMNSSLRTVSKDIKGLKRSSESLKRSSSSMASDIRSLRKAAAPPRSRD